MATDEIKAQLAKVRQEMAKLLELLEAVEPPAAKKTTRARN